MSVQARLLKLEKVSPLIDVPKILWEHEFDTRSEFREAVAELSKRYPNSTHPLAIEYGRDCDLRQDHPNYPGFDYER